jgi:spore coat polysaccharide biosynthesis protein SpsF
VRGDSYDVLDRYYQAARTAQADVIVRLTADCPVLDPALVDRTVRTFFGETQPQDVHFSQRAERLAALPLIGAYDFAANRLPPPWGRTYPIGLDVEVCSFAALEYAWQHADQKHEREHVMPYLYQTENLFSALLVHHTEDLGALRWTVDTPEDLEFIRAIYARFAGRDDFGWEEVLALVQREPELAQINADVRHKNLFEVDARAGDKHA